uniref:Uncharacterized protein n=1 Tax=Oryza glumipatula TaxID=40148 RepID=A0A0E0AEF7_9ORYZ
MAGGAALSGMAGGDGKKGARAAGNGGGHLCSAGYGRAVGGCGRAPAELLRRTTTRAGLEGILALNLMTAEACMVGAEAAAESRNNLARIKAR